MEDKDLENPWAIVSLGPTQTIISTSIITPRAPAQNQSNICRRRGLLTKNMEAQRANTPVSRKVRMVSMDFDPEPLKDVLTTPRIIIETIKIISRRCSLAVITCQE